MSVLDETKVQLFMSFRLLHQIGCPHLPTQIGRLKNLTELIGNGTGLLDLPTEIGNLESLQNL